MITAILKANMLTGKIRLQERLPEIRIPIMLPMTTSWLQEAFNPKIDNKHPVFLFEWRKQIAKYTHEYTLKEIS